MHHIIRYRARGGSSVSGRDRRADSPNNGRCRHGEVWGVVDDSIVDACGRHDLAGFNGRSGYLQDSE
jgi:hypothetical protein